MMHVFYKLHQVLVFHNMYFTTLRLTPVSSAHLRIKLYFNNLAHSDGPRK